MQDILGLGLRSLARLRQTHGFPELTSRQLKLPESETSGTYLAILDLDLVYTLHFLEVGLRLGVPLLLVVARSAVPLRVCISRFGCIVRIRQSNVQKAVVSHVSIAMSVMAHGAGESHGKMSDCGLQGTMT
jgi:hypothetical protein